MLWVVNKAWQLDCQALIRIPVILRYIQPKLDDDWGIEYGDTH